MTIADAKAEARRAAFARRREARQALGPSPRAATEAALEVLLARPEETIAGYVAIRTEIDPLPLMTRLHAAGRRIGAPVIEGAGLPLRFREWTPDSEMIDGPFGAAIPARGEWLRPGALIVPLVAFDAGLRRLGYGGGFYDRTLELLQREGGSGAWAMGFAYAAQEAGELPAEPTDRPLDAVVTEGGMRARATGS